MNWIVEGAGKLLLNLNFRHCDCLGSVLSVGVSEWALTWSVVCHLMIIELLWLWADTRHHSSLISGLIMKEVLWWVESNKDYMQTSLGRQTLNLQFMYFDQWTCFRKWPHVDSSQDTSTVRTVRHCYIYVGCSIIYPHYDGAQHCVPMLVTQEADGQKSWEPVWPGHCSGLQSQVILWYAINTVSSHCTTIGRIILLIQAEILSTI